MKEFKGKTAVVTGAASGVGKELARLFCQEGMKVVLADISASALEQTEAELRLSGHKSLLSVVTDVTEDESVARLADAAYGQFEAVHVLCNNAGVGLGEAKTPLWELPARDWQWGYEVNTFGVVNGLRHFVPRMLKSGQPGTLQTNCSP